MTTAVIAHHAFNVRRHGVQIADEIFDGFLFQVGLAGDGFIHVRHISAMMFVMMNFHRLGVNVRFQRIFRIRKRR